MNDSLGTSHDSTWSMTAEMQRSTSAITSDVAALAHPWADSFMNWEPQGAFHCPWCERQLQTTTWDSPQGSVTGWEHKPGERCFWSEFPLETSHPFVYSLLRRIRDTGKDQYSRIEEFSRVLTMFAFTPKTDPAAAW